MAPRVTWIAESKGQKRKLCVLRSRTHAHGQAEFQAFVGLEAQFCVRARVGTRSPLLSWPLWPSEWNCHLGVPAPMAESSHRQAARHCMILEFLLQNIASFWSRKNPRWIRGLLRLVQERYLVLVLVNLAEGSATTDRTPVSPTGGL